MNTTNILLTVALAIFPIAITLQTFWMSRGLTTLESRFDSVDRRLDTMHGDINGLRDELHAHEVKCEERSTDTAVRLAILEQDRLQS